MTTLPQTEPVSMSDLLALVELNAVREALNGCAWCSRGVMYVGHPEADPVPVELHEARVMARLAKKGGRQ